MWAWRCGSGGGDLMGAAGIGKKKPRSSIPVRRPQGQARDAGRNADRKILGCARMNLAWRKSGAPRVQETGEGQRPKQLVQGALVKRGLCGERRAQDWCRYGSYPGATISPCRVVARPRRGQFMAHGILYRATQQCMRTMREDNAGFLRRRGPRTCTWPHSK